MHHRKAIFMAQGNVQNYQAHWRYKGCDMTIEGSLEKFTDKNKISTWAQDAMKWAVGSGLMQGKGNNILDPRGTAARAEIAAVLRRFIGSAAL